MTNLEVEIISRETIKPSSPTPPHLRTFKLNLLDQMSPIVYPPLILYYSSQSPSPSPSPSPQCSNADHDLLQTDEEDPSAKLLKRSLSEALTRFYPLAGRIRENQFVDCNDEGVLCLVAKVSSNCPLSELLKQPRLESLGQFVPLQVIYTDPPEAALQLAVQLNLFSCGGIAIGVSASHKFIDAVTIATFLKCWGAIARGTSTCVLNYKLSDVDRVAASSTLFPPRESLPAHALAWLGGDSSSDPHQEGNTISTRRFVFDAEAISKLKAEARSEAVPNPTSNEALSGFIWKCLMNASKAASGFQIRPSLLANLVGLRRRVDPPSPEYTVGNVIWKAFSRCCDGRGTDHQIMNITGLQELVGLIRNSFAEINSEYVQKLVGDDGIVAISEWLEEVAELYSDGKPISYGFSSLRHMGFYEVDFGWGKPAWVGFKEVTECKNIVTFIETGGSGDGLEVWVTLDEQELFVLENDPDLLAFASLNPGIN